MNKTILILLAGTALIFSAARPDQKEFSEQIKKEFTLTGNASGTTLYIYNLSGSINIEGTSGNKVTVDIEKTVSAESAADLEKGKKEFRFEAGQDNDSIIVYMAEPFNMRPHSNNNYKHYDPPYEFNADFTVKVPSGINLEVSTINNGAIEINNVAGILQVNNINEGITITNAGSKTDVHTINGEVNVTYAANPSAESSYETINGDIRISYRPDLSADIKFKSMNGDLFTDFPDAELLPVSATKVREKKGGSMIYKLNKTTTVRFGKGGKTFSFETLNGNVYIKKQS